MATQAGSDRVSDCTLEELEGLAGFVFGSWKWWISAEVGLKNATEEGEKQSLADLTGKRGGGKVGTRVLESVRVR